MWLLLFALAQDRDAEIRQALRELDADEPAERDVAMRRLIDLGARAETERTAASPRSAVILTTLTLLELAPDLKPCWAAFPDDVEAVARAPRADWAADIGCRLIDKTIDERPALSHGARRQLMDALLDEERLRLQGTAECQGGHMAPPDPAEAWLYLTVMRTMPDTQTAGYAEYAFDGVAAGVPDVLVAEAADLYLAQLPKTNSIASLAGLVERLKPEPRDRVVRAVLPFLADAEWSARYNAAQLLRRVAGRLEGGIRAEVRAAAEAALGRDGENQATLDILKEILE